MARWIDVSFVSPLHIGHLRDGPDELAVALLGLYVAMAVQAPAHAERLDLMDSFHLINATVAFHAAYSSRDVNAVVEVDVVWELVNPNPLHRFAGSPAFPDRLELLGVRFHELVAIHAGLGRGDHRHGRSLHVHVAVATVEAKLPGVKPMRIRYRLARRIPDLREPGREVVPNEARHRDQAQRCSRADDQRQLVERARKNLHLGVGEPTGALSGAAGCMADAALTRSKSGPLGALIRNRALSDNRMFCERSARESPHAQEGYSRLGSDT